MRLLSWVLVLVVSTGIGAQAPQPSPVAPSSVAVPDESAQMFAKRQLDSLYLSHLERTNEQLSLRWNPLGVMIGALGLLFAVLAIGTTLVLFRQSKDYRETITKSVEKYQQVLDAFIADKNSQLELMRQETQEELASTRKKLNEAVDDSQRSALEARVARLEKLDKGFAGSAAPFATTSLPLQPRSGSISIDPNALSSLFGRKCVNCGKYFTEPSISISTSGVIGTMCPHCKTFQP